MSMRKRLKNLVIVILSSGAGCASHIKPRPADPGEPQLLELKQELPTSDGVSATDLYPLQTGQRIYRSLDESLRSGPEVVQSLAAASDFKSQFSSSIGDADAARIEYWNTNSAGDLTMAATIEHKDHALSLFDPPLVIAPAQLAPGKETTSQSKMRVVDLTNRAQQRESGTARQTVKYEADQMIRTPLGEFRARRITSHFVADLKLADADETSTMYVVPGMGIIAEQRTEQVKVFGLATRKSTQTLVLLRDAGSDPTLINQHEPIKPPQ
jgi:hypothetical protein